MSIAEKLTQVAENQQAVYNAGYAAGAENGGGATFTTLWRGKSYTEVTLSDSVLNYEYIIVVAGISGEAMYQVSGILSVADMVDTSATIDITQAYLPTPFEANNDGSIKNMANAVFEVNRNKPTFARLISNNTIGWKACALIAVIGVK